MKSGKNEQFKNIRKFINDSVNVGRGQKGQNAQGRRLISLDEALEVCATYQGSTARLPFNAVMRKGEAPSSGDIDTSGKSLDFLDRNLAPSVCRLFANSREETVDPSLLMKNKEYTFRWTNRVAIWRFFERYAVPIAAANEDKVGYLLKHQSANIPSVTGTSSKKHDHINPFHAYESAFGPIMQTWQPLMKRTLRIFVANNPLGANLKDDFLSISYIAFLHALEKQAMAILGSLERAQGIPFSKRLEFAIRKQIRCDLPNMTGPVRVPIESEQRKQMPTSVSLDVLLGDKPDNG
jgi:hypothetical protein